MVEEKKFEDLENSNVRLNVKVSAESTKNAYNDLLVKYSKKVQLPGFRKGKVPHEVLIRKFGEGLRQEAASELVDAALNEIFKDSEKKPISRPVLDDLPTMTPGDSYGFEVTYDVYPEVQAGNYKGQEITVPKPEILKKHVDEVIEGIREQNSVVLEKADSTVEKDSVVTMDYAELDEKDKAISNTKKTGFVFTVGESNHPYQIDKDIIGMKTGGTKVLEVKNEQGEESDSPRRLEVTITAVKERQLPDIDDELAQDVSDDLKTVADLKKKIQSDLETTAENKLRGRKITEITDKILEKSSVPVPESMVSLGLDNLWQDWIYRSGATEELFIKALAERGETKEQFLENKKEDQIKSITTSLVYEKIIEAEKIEIDDKELTEEIEKRAKQYNMPVEELEKISGGDHFKTHLRNELIHNKLFDFLIDSSIIKESGKINFTDLINS